jgi:2'-5' RNA ligase
MPLKASVSKTYSTAVVLIPPQDVWPAIQTIRQQYDRHLRRWMPHITLLYPFRPREDWPSILEQLEGVCQRTAPIRVRLATFRTFRHRNNYPMWLAPEPREALVNLQSALWRTVPDCDDAHRHRNGFTPHLSVGQAQGREQVNQLVTRLQEEWTPIQFVASEIELIWRNDPPDDVFRVGHRLKLGMGK